jgi:tetratricopeptide (TPR) repeat protein
VGKKHRARRTSAPAARPSGETAGLIAFVQQLLQEGRVAEALRAAQTLVESDPLNPMSHMVLGTLLMQLQRPAEAMRQFELGVRFGLENRAEALHDLAVAASMARFPIHALQAARAGLALRPSAEQQRILQSIVTGSTEYLAQIARGQDVSQEVAEDALLLVEQSNRAAQSGDEERAGIRAGEATRKAPHLPVVWHHLATLRFGADDVPGAIDACSQGLEEAGREHPLLLADLVRFHDAIGQRAEADATLARLLAVADPDDAATVEIAKGLAVYNRDEETHARLAPLAEGADRLQSAGRFMLGTALANLGRPDQARAAWRDLSRDGLPYVRAFTDMLVRREQPPTPRGRFPYFAAIELVPATVLGQVLDATQRDLSADVAPFAARFPRLGEALCETLFVSGVDPRLAVEVLLRLGDPDVPDAVRRFARGRNLDDYDRVFAHLALRGAGLDDPSTPAAVWLGGRRRELVLPAIRLQNGEEPTTSEEVQEIMRQAAEAQQQDDPSKAAERYAQALAIDPDVPEAEHNLGTALLLANRMQEGEVHVRRALMLEPDYVLARCNLAALELTRGNIAAAHEFLDPLDSRIAFTLEDVLAYLRTRADLALADGDPGRAETLLHALLAYDHENTLARERLSALGVQPGPTSR